MFDAVLKQAAKVRNFVRTCLLALIIKAKGF
jgi:hypothetical protein